jgi:hypothetical protein
MKKEQLLILFVILAVLFRLVPHPPNFVPITALALHARGHRFDSDILHSIC